MVTNEFAEASAEIIEILEYMPIEYVEKIPTKLIEFFNEVKKEEYEFKFDLNKQLDEQKLNPKTKTLLTIIYRNYWCNEEERAELDKILIENDEKYEEELRKKYDIDIFKRKEKQENYADADKTMQMIKYKKSIFRKILNIIFFFKKR
jgi:hypothetical protein